MPNDPTVRKRALKIVEEELESNAVSDARFISKIVVDALLHEGIQLVDSV